MNKFLNGLLGAGATMGMIALVIYPTNVAVRSWAAYRLARDPNNTTAEAVLFGF